MRGTVTLAGVTLAGMVLAGCAGTPPASEPTSASPATSVAPATSAAPSAPPKLTKAQKQARAAEAKVLAFYKLRDELYGDPSRSINELYDVSRGKAQEDLANSIRRGRNRGYVGEGGLKVTVLSTKAKGDSTWVVTVCTDNHGMRILDKNGDQVRDPKAPYQLTSQAVVERAKNNGRLYVITNEVVKTSC
jgi:hypothetical protein